jgi:hypothetical protein
MGATLVMIVWAYMKAQTFPCGVSDNLGTLARLCGYRCCWDFCLSGLLRCTGLQRAPRQMDGRAVWLEGYPDRLVDQARHARVDPTSCFPSRLRFSTRALVLVH